MAKTGIAIGGGGMYGMGPVSWLAELEASLGRLGFGDVPDAYPAYSLDGWTGYLGTMTTAQRNALPMDNVASCWANESAAGELLQWNYTPSRGWVQVTPTVMSHLGVVV